MRRLLSTTALVLVLGGLGAYIYFYLWNQPVADTTAKEKVFPGIEFDKISELKVKSESGDVTSVKKTADGWELVAPVTGRANDSDVTAIASAIANLEVTRVIEDKPSDLKPYGLDLPGIQVDYKSSDGKGAAVQIGQKTSTQAGLYAKRAGEDRVFLIAAYEEPILNKSTFDLRDKSLVRFQRDKVDTIDIETGGKTILLAKEGMDWKVTKPVADRADTSSVNSLMDKVETAQMKSIAATDPAPADLKKFGLDKPDVAVSLNQGSSRATLIVGGAADDSSVYARDVSKAIVVTVDKMLAASLKSPADDYRRKDLFDFRPFNAARVEFTRKGETVAFERVKGEKDNPDKWRRVSPNAADVDKNKVETMLGDFADLRVGTFAAPGTKTGLDSPALVVNAKFGDDNKEEKVTFGQVGGDIFASRPGASGPGKLDADRYKDAVMRLDELAK